MRVKPVVMVSYKLLVISSKGFLSLIFSQNVHIIERKFGIKQIYVL